ncbi:MAG: macA 1 [Burkholderiaceae bacterium]|nr:macA 1 [Burkholderiaceae bacterium]
MAIPFNFFALSRRKQWVTILLLVLALFIGFRVFQALTKASRAKAPPASVVQIKTSELAEVQPTAFNKVLPLSGSLNPYQQTLISARASGEVAQVLVREGQTVNKGDVLAELSTITYQAQVDQARAAVNSAQQSLALAQQDYKNNKELLDAGFIAKMALQRIEVNRQSAQSALTQAQQSLVIAQRSLNDARISAPIAGVVAARKVNVGDTVGIGSPLFSIVNDNTFELASPIPAEQIGQVQVGQSVQLRTAGVANEFAGTIERVNPAAQAGSRSYMVYVRVFNNGQLRSGMFAEGSILLSSRPNILSIPATAVRSADGASHVYVVNNGVLEKRNVTVGERASEQIDAPIEITSGLSAGERVVRLDLGMMKPNLKVELLDDTGTVPSAESSKDSTAPQQGLITKIKAWFSKK